MNSMNANARKAITLVRLFAVALAASAAMSAAGAWPEKPVRMIVPFPPGGATDVIARVIAQELSGPLGQQVVVENRAGATGNIGADLVAKSAPDGYTLLLGALTSHSINVTLQQGKLPYDLEKDFAPVSIAGVVPLVFVVHPSVPANSLKELIALAKSRPGYLTYASSGQGGPQHLAGELFQRVAGVQLLHVPYKGSGPAMTDLIGGQVLTMIETAPAAMPFIKSGKLRALAAASAQRIPNLAEVPTATEAGLPGYEVSSMFGLVAPAGTPRAVIMRLNAEVVRILQVPEVKEKMLQQGVVATPTTPEQAAQRIHDEVAKWAKVIKDANVKAE
jgi:tripartite-type tricarboxylate transporter receptor subunit TctC